MSSNIFVNKYFYKSHTPHNLHNIFINNVNRLYFRKYFYAHKTLTIEHSYFIRLKSKETFSLKLYVLKYNNWVIISVQKYKPIKVSLKVTNKNIQQLPLIKSKNQLTNTNSFFKKRFMTLLNLFQLHFKRSKKALVYTF